MRESNQSTVQRETAAVWNHYSIFFHFHFLIHLTNLVNTVKGTAVFILSYILNFLQSYTARSPMFRYTKTRRRSMKSMTIDFHLFLSSRSYSVIPFQLFNHVHIFVIGSDISKIHIFLIMVMVIHRTVGNHAGSSPVAPIILHFRIQLI